MKEALPNPTLEAGHIQGTVSTGFVVKTRDGAPARLAIIDEHGNVIEAGKNVEQAAWRLCVEVQENFWEGKGHLVVHTEAPGKLIERGAA
ncbi:hypothetical protein [Pseudomonas oryzihabitans]|uniref:hypothetical protein n=1 Tax=Pseudomonas oryzihabitans TaxID=47885 RepID=UPI002899FD2B|nr:hypothetical protein [Pseudomonas oryzihabitans]